VTIWTDVVEPVTVHALAVVRIGVAVGLGAALAAGRVAAGVADAVAPLAGEEVVAVTCVLVARCVPAPAGVLEGVDAVDGVVDTEIAGVGVSCTSTFAVPLLQAVAASSRLRPVAIVPVVRMSATTDRGTGRFSACFSAR
jgi:hypothetical protein